MAPVVHMADITNRSQHSGSTAAPVLSIRVLLNTEACTAVTCPLALEVWGQLFGLDLQYSCGVCLESSVAGGWVFCSIKGVGIYNKQFCPEHGLDLAVQ